MFLRKLITRSLLLFALFYLFTRPASAAEIVNHTMHALHGAADGLAGFLTRLN
ncbi:hypothetical protein [Sphaerimonospora mesophila]|uniref:hypothetical protein n=1 Tax=Sphaerimonospora mesophila TaxID=37483 RepID=UPI000AD8B5B6